MSSCPVLAGTDRPVYPAGGRCPVCGGPFASGVAYLSAGALPLTADGQDGPSPGDLRAFLHLGFHGRAPDMRDSSDVTVVEDLHGGQFDLQWCSVECLRQWLLGLLRRIEAAADGGSAADADPGIGR